MAHVWCLLLLCCCLCSAADAAELRGTVTGVSEAGRVVIVGVEGKEPVLVQYDDRTVFREIATVADLREGESVVVDYRELPDRTLATSIALALPALAPGVTVTPRSEIERYVSAPAGSKPFFLADIRPVDAYAAGHIPGAESTPLPFLEKRRAEQLPEDKRTQVVFYADRATDGSLAKATDLARKYRHQNVAVYRGGMGEWLGTGNPVVSSLEGLKTGMVLFIDLRSEDAVSAGHIPEAVNIPADRLREELLPADKRVSLIFYGDGTTDVARVVRAARGWGYRKASMLAGGFGAWLESGEAPATGAAPGDLRLVKAPVTGALGARDLKNAMESGSVVSMLDVRPATDFAAGTLPGAVTIPLASLGKRLGELDRKKIIVTFSSDVDRARVAYRFLLDRGYRAMYLDAPLRFGKDGSYRVME